MKDLAQAMELGQKLHQRDKESVGTLQTELREELVQSGIAEHFNTLLKQTGSVMHLDLLFQQWSEDKNSSLDELPRKE